MGLKLTDESMCSACFQQRPEIKHVDFDCNWDGPAFTATDSGYPHNQIDDLILCEACIRSAAGVLRLKDDPVEPYEREIARLKAELEDAIRYGDALEDVIPRRPGRPKKDAPTFDDIKQGRGKVTA